MKLQEKEIIVIEDMLKLQTCHCNHELIKLQNATDSYEESNDIYSYTWSPEITNEQETILIVFRNLLESFTGHLFYDRKALNEFILFIKRTHTRNKEINYRHILVTTHFIVVFLKKNEDYFSPIERDALVMSALCHYIHKCEPTYSFIYESIFKTFRICDNSSKLVNTGLLTKMKRWKYFYPCNYLSDIDKYKKKYYEIVNLIGKKKFNLQNKCHRELVILAIIINADKSMYYKHKVFMSHHDEYCLYWNIEFSLYKKEKASYFNKNNLWTPKLLDKNDTEEYQLKKQLAVDLINSFLQPWFNILKILFEDTEYLQHYLDKSIQLLKQHEKEVKEERRKTFIFTLKPTGLWLGPEEKLSKL
ncbi:unnamed protein product [Nezara viridula]|uniref:Uncharacterized protein n=1 Tax=Nezara viridula TaxID=85310 RepID=A0A9P0HGB6_NEZVI|nr:unnamed protein product [Nezara viridula]